MRRDCNCLMMTTGGSKKGVKERRNKSKVVRKKWKQGR